MSTTINSSNQTITQYNVQVGAALNVLTSVAPSSTSGVPLISQGSSSNPAFGTAVVAGGGTGAVTLTAHGVLVGEGTSAIAATAAGSAGQVLQSGGASADPVYSTATYPATAGTAGNFIKSDGTNFSSASIPGGGLVWSTVTVDATMAVNTGTVANKAGLLTMTLPATSAVGDTVAITGINTALGWKIGQNAGNQIFFGTSSTTAGTGGSLASINIHDTVTLVCVTASANWSVLNSVGNITVV